MTDSAEALNLAVQLFDLIARDALRHAEEFESSESLQRADAYFGAKHLLQELTGGGPRSPRLQRELSRLGRRAATPAGPAPKSE